MFAGTGLAEADLGEDWFFVSFFYTFLQMRQHGNSIGTTACGPLAASISG